MKTHADEQATILVVDDRTEDLRLLVECLQEAGLKTFVARSGEGALRQVEFAKPDVILLDVLMPGMDGFETCLRFKRQQSTKDIPIIFLTGLAETVDKIKGIQAGGADYVTKPFNHLELLTRVKIHLDLQRYKEAVLRSHQEVQQANLLLLHARKQLERTISRDLLTQLPNRQNMREKMEYERIRFERSQRPFALILCDIDRFKRVNESFGQGGGDAVLVSLARFLRNSIRKQDILARWGGEEFLFLLPETRVEGALCLTEKMRMQLAEHSFEFHGHSVAITGTFGISIFDDYAKQINECLKYSQQALSRGKDLGGNCVNVWEEGTS